jgi:hypothetical protein
MKISGSPNRRLLASLAGGVLISLLALGGAFLGSLVFYLWHVKSALEFFVWLIAWPLAVLKPVTPNSEDPSREAANLRFAILIAVPVLDVLAYSLLTYIVLWWRDNRKGLR